MPVFKRGTTGSIVAPSFYTMSLPGSLISSGKPRDFHQMKKNSWKNNLKQEPQLSMALV